MMRTALILTFAISAGASAQVITPYTLCKAQQDKLLDETTDQSTPCRKQISESARCCVGAKNNCAVPGKTVPQVGGANGLAQMNIQGDQLNMAGIGQMKKKCEDTKFDAVKPCSANPKDKADRQKYDKLQSELEKCLDGESAASAERIVKAGGTLENASGNRNCSGADLSPEQMIKCLKEK